MQSMSSVPTVVHSANTEESSMENLDGGEGQGEKRRRSILGLTQASAGSKEGLGPWKVRVLRRCVADVSPKSRDTTARAPE